MNHLVEKLEKIHLEILNLSKEFDKLNSRNHTLEIENQTLKENLIIKTEKIKKLKNEKKNIINAKSLKELGLNKIEGRHKINELVRSIDKCIAQLNK